MGNSTYTQSGSIGGIQFNQISSGGQIAVVDGAVPSGGATTIDTATGLMQFQNNTDMMFNLARLTTP
jgi:hypothetical protein